MEVMVLHEENIKSYSELGTFNISVIEKNPENYIFFLTPNEFGVVTQLYVEVGAALTKKGELKESPEWKKHGILTSLAITFNIIGVESTKKNGFNNGYIMASLTPYMMHKDVYAVFLTKRNDIERRTKEILKQLDNWQKQMKNRPNN